MCHTPHARVRALPRHLPAQVSVCRGGRVLLVLGTGEGGWQELAGYLTD